MSPSNITRAGLITIISSPWKGCLKSPKRQVHGMLPWHAFSWIHCFSRLSPLQLHVSLQGNIHPVHELNWKTFNWSSLLQPTAEFWTQVHCRTILTQTVFFGYLQCITGPKCLSILNCWTFLSSSTWHV